VNVTMSSKPEFKVDDWVVEMVTEIANQIVKSRYTYGHFEPSHVEIVLEAQLMLNFILDNAQAGGSDASKRQA